jgi:sigma54-dependent transcription regulator
VERLELVARAVHKRSRRSQRAFVSVNCAALTPSLISSELFGHEKGAFTGAMQRRLGRFELANGGTIFLEEIGELPLDTQVAPLRMLQERESYQPGMHNTVTSKGSNAYVVSNLPHVLQERQSERVGGNQELKILNQRCSCIVPVSIRPAKNYSRPKI